MLRGVFLMCTLCAVIVACPGRPTHCPLAAPSEAELFQNVCLHGGTEERQDRCAGVPPALGNFTCACCGNTLFRAADKCHSGTGWPSFTAGVGTCVDPKSFEVVCGRCGAHLGDYFFEEVTGDCVLNGQPSRFCIDGVCLKPPAGSVYGSECGAALSHPQNPALAAPSAQAAVTALLAWAVAHSTAGDYSACHASVNNTLGAQSHRDGSLLVVYNVTTCAAVNASHFPQGGLLSGTVNKHGVVVQTPWAVVAPLVSGAGSSPYTAAFGVPVALAFLGVAVLGFVAGKVLRNYYSPTTAVHDRLVVLDDGEAGALNSD